MKNNIGDNIKYFRKKNLLTVEELAKLLNVASSTLYNWERGFRIPDITQLIKISELFKISLDDLVGEKGLKKFQQEIMNYNKKKLNKHFGNDDIYILFKEIDILSDLELEQIEWAINEARKRRN